VVYCRAEAPPTTLEEHHLRGGQLGRRQRCELRRHCKGNACAIACCGKRRHLEHGQHAGFARRDKHLPQCNTLNFNPT
jgi:hypothetical protein